MKKFVALFLAMIMVFSFAACSKDTADTDNSKTDAPKSPYNSALEVLDTVWNSTPDESRFPCFGGNQDENANFEGPAAFNLTDEMGAASLLLIPADVRANLDDAASLVHMMNANTFTGAVVHVNGDVAAAADGIKNAVLTNQFICGAPEKLVIYSVGDYLFYAFGASDIIADVSNTVATTVTGSALVADEVIG